MLELKALYEKLGFSNIKTCIQSGKVVFSSESQAAILLTGRIEAQLQSAFEYLVTVII